MTRRPPPCLTKLSNLTLRWGRYGFEVAVVEHDELVFSELGGVGIGDAIDVKRGFPTHRLCADRHREDPADVEHARAADHQRLFKADFAEVGGTQDTGDIDGAREELTP